MVLDHPRRISLDYTNTLLIAAPGVGGLDKKFDLLAGDAFKSVLSLDPVQKRVRWSPAGSTAVDSATFPSVVHFPGKGHWPRGDQHCVMVEVVRRRYPAQLKALGFNGAPGDWRAACGMIGADLVLAELETGRVRTHWLVALIVILALCCACASILAVHFKWRHIGAKKGGQKGRGGSLFHRNHTVKAEDYEIEALVDGKEEAAEEDGVE
jgi:hypothetical protein